MQPAIAPPSARSRPGIENRPLTSLRGFAAVWVIFSHITAAFTGQWGGWSWRMLRDGYMGVDVFFVLSGFILGVVYLDLRPAGVPRFFLKRLLRLYPLNLAILLAILLLSWTVMPLGPWADLHLLPMFALMVEGYMPWPVASWNPNTWSVGIELACYIIFPPAILALRRLPTGALLALAVALLAISWWVQGFCLGWPVGWHALARGMSGFWPGVALAVLATRLPPPPAVWAGVGEAACVAGLLAAVALDLLPLVPACAGGLVFLLYFDAGPVARFLRRPACFWLGEVSFSIYMLFGILLPHVMGVAIWLLARLPAGPAIVAFVAFYLGLVLILAQVTFVTIERPCRRLARKRRPAYA